VQLAAPVALPLLLLEHFGHLVVDAQQVEWDARSETVIARRVRRLGELVLEEAPLRNAGALAVDAMVAGIRSLGLGCLPWTRDLEQWRARVEFARAHDARPDAGWPDVSDAALLDTLAHWLGPWLEGVTRRDQLAASRPARGPARPARLGRPAPPRCLRATHLTVPSGSRIAIDYQAACRSWRCACRKCSASRPRPGSATVACR